MLSCSLWQAYFEAEGHPSLRSLLLLTVSLEFCADLHLARTRPVLSAVPAVSWLCEDASQAVTNPVAVK